MHDTSVRYAHLFHEIYLNNTETVINFVDVGSQDVNGCLRPMFTNPLIRYTGVDYSEGNNVDVVLKDPYRLPFKPNSVDVMISSSCFEHVEFFWVMFEEMLRVLKPDGLLYINAPCRGGNFHRHPVDCWRFYPDSGRALARWGQRQGYNCDLIESFVGHQALGGWSDFVGVFIKDVNYIDQYPNRIQHHIPDYDNGLVYGSDHFTNLNQNHYTV